MSLRTLPRLAQIFLVLAILLTSLALIEDLQPSVEASPRAGKQGRKTGTKRVRRRRVIRRTISKRRVHSRAGRARLAPPAPGTYPIAPDRIEVFESNSTDLNLTNRLLDLPKPAPFIATSGSSSMISSSRRRISTRIDSGRVIEIQRALRERGLYDGEMNGNYDEATVASMRQFQLQNKIPITGYPTAHALKRLGLAN